MVDKVCVVVGAGPGIGLAVAKRFAREGYRPVLVARRVSELGNYAAEVGSNAYTVAADAGNPVSLREAFSEIAVRVGKPEVLVYNAAAVHDGKPSILEVDSLIADFRVNVGGALVAAQQVIGYMREAKRGTILLTGGGLALNPAPTYASLAIGKAGLRSLAYSLAGELEPDGIHVATVTVAGFVQKGTYFDPDSIAEVYWTLHSQPAGSWEHEVIYRQP
ncbi:MAG: SDR family NAD(P)-dependent oxidoreductase [bacterium]|nr:SDR family NAD(P)-dependent oxidoreductase [bacterium]